MATTRLQIPVPINEAEAIIEPFWDARLTHLAEWQVQGAPGANARSSQFWCWCALEWDHAPTTGPVLTFTRTMNVALGDFDRLLVRLAMPKHIRVTVRATIDGRERTVIDAEPGRSVAHEYEGPVSGRRLERLTIAISTERDQPENLWLPWIGLAHDGRRAVMLNRPKPFDETWEGWLLPADASLEFKPRFGFFFDAADLPAIRRRARSAAYKPLVDELRATVAEAMAFHRTPEDQIGPHLGTGQVWQIQARERDYDTRPYYNDAPACAFLGLIDEDPVLLRFAARIAMSLCFTDTWQPHFMQSFPGSTWDTRAFPEAMAIAPLVMAADWAGSYLTANAEHLIRYAITHKGMGRVRGAFLHYNYMWDINQTHLIMPGRLLGLLYQQRDWPRTAPDIDQCERDIYEMIDRYIQEDGSTNEGMGYWGASFHCTLQAMRALARYRGKPVADLLPAKLHRMWNYVAPLLSTAGAPGSYLTTSDCVGDLLNWDTISLLGTSGVRGGWMALLGERLRCGDACRTAHGSHRADGLMTLIYGPDEPPTLAADWPVFARLDKVGTVTSNRPWGAGNVRLSLLGQMANAGHSHADKGSFILEANGDLFGGDRGMTPYEDAEGWLAYKSEFTHNLAQPEGATQLNPAPVATLWQATGDEKTLSAEIDTSAIWKAPVRQAVRRISSPRPDLIEIVDEFELDEPRPVHWYLNTPLPIAVQGKEATVQGQRARLTVTAEWAEKAEAGPFYADWSYRPYNRLVFTSAAAKKHVLKTVLSFAS